MVADEKGLILQINIQEKTLVENQELLKNLGITAPSSGIILAVAGSNGERVDKDKLLVRMSDLTSFKVIGSIEEQFAKYIKTGTCVLVGIDNENLEDRIGNITPMVENQKVQFNIHLKEKSHPKLIANQNVTVAIVNSRQEGVPRIKKLPELEKGKAHQVFIVRGSDAIRTEINLGTIGNDWCEIISGASEGDEIIVESINSFRGLDKIVIEN